MAPTVPVFVGLDYSQTAVQVCVLDHAGKVLANARCPDDARRIDEVARRFGTVRGAALEACTGAANLAEELTDRFAWPMHLAHPGFVSRMKQSPDKSDFSDARVLADLERVGYLPRVWIAPKLLRAVCLRHGRCHPGAKTLNSVIVPGKGNYCLLTWRALWVFGSNLPSPKLFHRMGHMRKSVT